MSRFIPLSIPNFEGNEKKYVDEAIEQGWVSTGGKYISELEEKLTAFLKTNAVAACQSGTSAIHLSLIEAGVQPGDMVIVPTLTFIAAVNPVKYQFADPIFMDCDDSLCIDPQKVEKFCRDECHMENNHLVTNVNGKIIRAIIVVHVFGNMVDMEKIMDIASRYNLKVIEDATEALGTVYSTGKYKGKYAGTIGDYGAYSFNGNKIITTGGGGAVTARKKETVNHLRYLSTQAKDDPHFYVHNEVGYNYRMTNVQAAIGVAQMEELQEFIERKNENYDLYKKIFSDYKMAELVAFRKGTYSNRWFYSLKINMEKLDCSMRDIIFELEKKEIQTRAIWGLIHEQKPYSTCIKYKIESARYYSQCILNIPSSTQLNKEDIIYAAEKIKETINEHIVS